MIQHHSWTPGRWFLEECLKLLTCFCFLAEEITRIIYIWSLSQQNQNFTSEIFKEKCSSHMNNMYVCLLSADGSCFPDPVHGSGCQLVTFKEVSVCPSRVFYICWSVHIFKCGTCSKNWELRALFEKEKRTKVKHYLLCLAQQFNPGAKGWRAREPAQYLCWT